MFPEHVQQYRNQEIRELQDTMKTQSLTDNTAVRKHIAEHYPDIYDYDSFHNLVDSEVEDICHGATKQGNWSKPTSSYRLFMLLGMLDEISNETIRECLEPRQMALHGKPYTIRTLQRWVQVLRCASGGLKHYWDLYE